MFDEFCKKMNKLTPKRIEQFPDSMAKHIEFIQICMKQESITIHCANILYYIFKYNQDGMIEEIEESDDEETNVANTWYLPNKEFDGLYER